MTTKTKLLRPAAVSTLAVALLVASVGCGGPARGDVTGTVTMNGKPVVYGTITFIGEDGITKAATITPDGKYSVYGVVVGTATIVLDSPKPPVAEAPAAGGGRGGRGRGRGTDPELPTDAPPVERDPDTQNTVSEEVAKKWFPIPKEYTDNTRSTLKYTVQPGANTHDVVLK